MRSRKDPECKCFCQSEPEYVLLRVSVQMWHGAEWWPMEFTINDTSNEQRPTQTNPPPKQKTSICLQGEITGQALCVMQSLDLALLCCRGVSRAASLISDCAACQGWF
jgi:hypothetical protein